MDSFFCLVVEINQARVAPSTTRIKGISFWYRGIDIISCFKGATHMIIAPEITDIEARVNIGEVSGLLSSR
jgi:hypothetical protein